MKKKTDALFELIASLTKAEKRQFKILANSGEGEKNFLRLFEAMERMKPYDEEAIKVKFKGEKFVDQLHVTKNYLTKKILEALRSIDEKNFKRAKVENDIRNIKILNRKRLNKHAMSLLKKAKDKAYDYELLGLAYEIVKLEIKIVLEQKPKKMQGDVEALYKECETLLAHQKEDLSYQKIDHQLLIGFRTGVRGNPDLLAKLLAEVKSSVAFQQQPSTKYFYPNYLFFNIHGLYHNLKGDFPKAKEYFKQMVELWEENKPMQARDPRKYKVVLYNYLQNCHKTGDYSEFKKYIEIIDSLPRKSKDEAGETFQLTSQLRLLLYMNTDKYEEAKKIIPDIEKGLTTHKDKINEGTKTSMLSNFVIIHLALEDYDMADTWAGKIWDLGSLKIRRDLQFPIFVMRLIALFEQKKTTFALNLIPTGKARFKKRNTSDFEKCIWKYFPKILKIQERSNMGDEDLIRNYLKKMETTLAPLLATETTFGLHEVYFWVLSKLTGRSFRDILKGF